MKEFILLFRTDITNGGRQQPEEKVKQYAELWRDWISDITAMGKLGDVRHELLPSGKVLKHGRIVVDSAYMAGRSAISGCMFIYAEDLDDALKIATGCPLLKGEGASVEVREIQAARTGM